MMRPLSCAAAVVLAAATAAAQASPSAKPRARDLGVPFDGTPGALNAITDVPGVEVGQVTLIAGAGRLVVGQGPVRTGVTAILPRGKAGGGDPVMAGWSTLNGNGEMTGTAWLEETGFLRGPVMITNTYSVGVVRDAVVGWLVRQGLDWDWSLPVVAETWDGGLNDIEGFHVTKEDAFRALDSARGGPVAEGDVGGGTGMICHRWKGGIGTASRRFHIEDRDYTLGVLVQCNYGTRPQLHIAGVPVGREIPDQLPCFATAGPLPRADERFSRCSGPGPRVPDPGGDADGGARQGSIIVVVATDVPLLPGQLKRVAKRVTLGIARMGGVGGDGSGDLFVAFSTANPGAATPHGHPTVTYLPNEEIDPVFEATAQAVEEAIVNALVAAETMTGVNDLRVTSLPHDRLRGVLRKYNRLAP